MFVEGTVTSAYRDMPGRGTSRRGPEGSFAASANAPAVSRAERSPMRCVFVRTTESWLPSGSVGLYAGESVVRPLAPAALASRAS